MQRRGGRSPAARHRSWYPPTDNQHKDKEIASPIQPSSDADDGQDQDCASSVAEREEGVMTQRLEVWVQRRLTSLPKSKSTLLRSLRADLCSLRRQVYTPDAALARLVREGFIELLDEPEPDGRREHESERAPVPPPASRRPSVKLAFRSSPAITEGRGMDDDDEAKEVAMSKMRQWVARQEAQPKTAPSTVEATKHALGQLCLVDVGFRPERLLELLEAKRYLRLDKAKDQDGDEDERVVWLLNEREGAKRKGKCDGDAGDERQIEETKKHQEKDKEEGKRKSKKKRT